MELRKRAGKRVSFETTGPSLAKQSFKKECDINNIMNKYKKTGVITHLATPSGKYGDFSQATDYQTSLNTVMYAQTLFNELNSDIRAKFNNDPSQFLEYAENPDNLEGMIEMGLAEAPKPAETATATAEAAPAKEAATAPAEAAKGGPATK